MTDPAPSKMSLHGCGIALRRTGAGRPLLYLHGPNDVGQWLPVLDDLAARHDVLAPEHPGFGASDLPAWLDTVPDLANFYLDLIDQLDLHDVDLIGHDLGGWIAAELAVRNPQRLASLTLVAAAGIHVPGLAQIDPFLRTDEQRIRDLFHDPGRADEAVRRVLRPDAEDQNIKNHTAAARLTWQPRGYDPHLAKWLHRIKLPTLLVWGADDRLLPPAYASAWQKRIAGAQLVVIPDCGHLPHVEQPQAFVAAAETFFDRMRIAA